MVDKIQFLSEFVQQRHRGNQYRSLKNITESNGVEIHCDGKKLVNFSSNNCLGLADHPLLKQRSIEFIERYGTGSGSSRLVCGNFQFHNNLETTIASLTNSESALLFNSGYQANATLLPALANRHTLILVDRNCHQSLLYGALSSNAKVVRYRHNDLSHLKALLRGSQDQYNRIWVVTESLFSMDGDLIDIESITALTTQYNALLYIDDAHSVGIDGLNGMGCCSGKKNIDIVLGAFGKAAGASGAFVTCSAQMREYLLQACAGIIYTTAVSPAIVGAIDAALELIPSFHKERQKLNSNSSWLRRALTQNGWNIGNSKSHILPLILDEETTALNLANELEREGLLIIAIRPPTVPEGTSRLRISVSSMHTQSQLEALVLALQIKKNILDIC